MNLILKKPFLFFLSLFILIAYQNCIEVGFNDKTDGSINPGPESPSSNPADDKTPGAGNGEGYGGKDPVSAFFVLNYSEPCSDPSDPNPQVTDRIVLGSDDSYYLEKEDCVELAQAKKIADGDLKFDDSNPFILFYLDTVFEGNKDGSQTPPDPDSQLVFHCSSTVRTIGESEVRYKLEVRREGISLNPPLGTRRLIATRIENKGGAISTSSTGNNTDKDIIITNPGGTGQVTTWSFNNATGVFDLRILATPGDANQFKIGTFQGTMWVNDVGGTQFDVECFSAPNP